MRRDFDISPFFEVVKPRIVGTFDTGASLERGRYGGRE